MKTQTTISLLAAIALALASVSAIAQGNGRGHDAQALDRAQGERGQKDVDRDRLRDRDRITLPAEDRARDRDRDRTHIPGSSKLGEQPIYGAEIMSVEERKQYREQLRLTGSDPKARTKLMAQHQAKMQARAKQQGVKLKDIPEPEEAE